MTFVRSSGLIRRKGISICLRGKLIRIRLRSLRLDMPREKRCSVLWIIWLKRLIRIWRHFISPLCFLYRLLGIMLWICFKGQFLNSIRFSKTFLWNLKLLQNWRPELRRISCLRKLSSKPSLDWVLNRKTESKIWSQFSKLDSKILMKIFLFKSQFWLHRNTWFKPIP